MFHDSPLVPRRLADYMQGFGLVWVMQLHMSWTLLVPFAAIAWVARLRRREALPALGAFLLGCATTGSLLVPTFVAHDLGQVGSTGVAVRFNPINARDLGSIAGKVLSFASYELPRFIASNNRARMAWLTSDWRIAPSRSWPSASGCFSPSPCCCSGSGAARWRRAGRG